MLCEFAQHFPIRLAELRERDRHLTRNFREETCTDALMSGLIPLEPFGVLARQVAGVVHSLLESFDS